MSCDRCGRCCNTYKFVLKENKDMARFWRYHGFEVVFRDGEMDVYGASPCKHLTYGAGGKAECDIYVSRPQFCHDWLCEKAR